jgi:hypothetical protein
MRFCSADGGHSASICHLCNNADRGIESTRRKPCANFSDLRKPSGMIRARTRASVMRGRPATGRLGRGTVIGLGLWDVGKDSVFTSVVCFSNATK